MPPLATQTTQPVEDISTVLGRFHAWAGKPDKPGTGAREISYEEAVQSSRYRRRADHVPVPALTAKPAIETKKKTAAIPAGKGRAAVKTPVKSPQGKRATPKVAREAKRVSAPRKNVREKYQPAGQKDAKAQPQFRQILETSVAAEITTAPMRPVPAASNAVAAQPRSADPGRPVMLSVRISAAEQALIRTRAQEANVSISAYMRQCALEVEQLRDQVERTLAAMQRAVPQQPLSAPPQSTPGFFVRMTQRFFGLGTRSTLALRA